MERIKKAYSDLVNGRGDAKTNVSKIVYYTLIQNIIFNALQQGLFALAFTDDDEEDSEKKMKKYISVGNGMADSLLRGLGYAGAAVATIKNVLLELERRKGWKRPNYQDAAWKLLDISPPIDSKISKIRSSLWLWERESDAIETKGYHLDNPAWDILGNVVSAATNIPMDRVLRKIDNVRGAVNQDNEWWRRISMLLGWSDWNLDVQKEEFKKVKSE
jgi:hypothetical protein